MTRDDIIGITKNFILVLIGIGIGYAKWGAQELKIVMIPNTQAKTETGVKQAANASDVVLDNEQAKEVAQNVEKAQKDHTVSTTVENIPQVSEAERKKAGADFSMITDPKNPDESFDLSKYDKNTPVELNQYNIRAYKKLVRGVSYYPESVHDLKPAMISADYSWRVSRSGKYLGVAAAYNWDSKKAYAGLRYEF